VEFFNVLTGPELLELTEAHLPEHRAAVSADGGVVDVHDEDGSCQKVVNGWAARREAEGLSANSIGTGSYCKARQRLPIGMATIDAVMNPTVAQQCSTE
jgi:hypothetical protein